MADIAVVFHWAPESMDGMPLLDLMGWRERARARSEAPRDQANGQRSGKGRGKGRRGRRN